MENKEKLFLMSLGFGLGISKLILALTTAIFVYPTVSGKVIELGYSNNLAAFAGVIASVVIALSIDGLAGLFFPGGLSGLIYRQKGRWLYVFITVIGLALYGASATFSIWMAPMVSDVIVSEPKDSFMLRYDIHEEMYNKGLDILNSQVEKYEIELQAAKEKADLSYLADHPNNNVKKQLLSYINSSTSTWASENITGFKTKVRRAKRDANKAIEKAQSKYDKAVTDRSEYIASAGAKKDKRQEELEKASNGLKQDYENEKTETENVVIWIDLIMLFIIVFANPIRIYYAKINGEELPESRSIAFAFYRVWVAITNRLVWFIEFLTRIDVNGDGVTGKPKNATTVKPNLTPAELIPVNYSGALQNLSQNKTLEIEQANKLRSLEKEIERLRNESLGNKPPKKKTKAKPREAVSLKGSEKKPPKKISVIEVPKFKTLDASDQAELLKYSKELLSTPKKKFWPKVAKDIGNAKKAAVNSSKGGTRARNAVKAVWLEML